MWFFVLEMMSVLTHVRGFVMWSSAFQVDVAILDFAKAFDKVAHATLAHKL